MDVVSVELGDNEIEIVFADGSKEEIEYGIFEKKAPNGDTIEQRKATAADMARLSTLAAEFEASLMPLDAEIEKNARAPWMKGDAK